jgi:pimeloyl-ACP methyl ester carboxylesterase
VTLVDHLAGLPGLSLTSYATVRRAVLTGAGGRDPDEGVPAHLRGRGAVVLVGGFCTTDAVLAPMRDWLCDLGYSVVTHTLHSGMDCGSRSVDELRATVDRAARRDGGGEGVHVVGYSRGGQFGRAVAADPGAPVRSLVTVGTPFSLFRLGLPVALPALAVMAAGTLGLPNTASSTCLVGSCCADYRRGLRAPVPVPFTSVYSRQDRLVPWRSSVDEQADNVEVTGSHLDLVEAGPARLAVARALVRHTARTAGRLPAGASRTA